MINYNPFKKNISELEKIDLEKLISENVAEGWYIEYKGDFPPSNKKISHSIASFANSDGGWYIVGIEDEDSTNIANNIIGIDLNIHLEPKEKISNIIRTHIKPIPRFLSKLIEISNNKSVLVVYIERGEETPYITRDGKVYQRIGEVSDPVPIDDYYAMQKLFERSEESKIKIEHFSQNPFGISKKQASENASILEAYFYVKPSNFEFKNFYTKEFFVEIKDNFSEPVTIIDDAPDLTANTTFNNILSSSESYILRNIYNEESSIDLVTTLELFNNGNLKLFLHIPTLPLNDDWENFIGYNHYTTIYEKFFDLLSDTEKEHLRIIDGHSLLTNFVIIFNQYLRLLKQNGMKDEIGVRFRISNTWRNLLFFNDTKYLDILKSNGLPICLKSNIEIPEFKNGNIITINSENNRGNESFLLMNYIYEALGLPQQFISHSLEGLTNYIIYHPTNVKNQEDILKS